jgi:hypothetical protein
MLREALGTGSKIATINAALRAFALRGKATEIVAAFDSVQMDFAESDRAWGYGGGRDLSQLADEARGSEAA